MDAFSMSIAGKVAGNVASSLVKALGRQLRDATLGTPEEQAMARVVTAGLAGIAERYARVRARTGVREGGSGLGNERPKGPGVGASGVAVYASATPP